MKIIEFVLLMNFLASTTCILFGQVAVGSSEELIYEFQALEGETQRPFLNYRTLSDSDWNGPEMLTVYGPELFTSYNSTAPYGQNDGALWQGRGVNLSLTGGFRYEYQGLELVYKPQLSFSQNQEFDLMDSAYESEFGYIWGYAYNIGIDAPQRFGDNILYGYNWGDSEIRYTWKTLTVGFGTQSPWIGPGHINAIMHSNNASPYPKLDLGIRRTPVVIKGFYLGDIEARLWGGYLSESEYFDSIESNDHNLISALAVSFAPSFLPGLSLSINRSYLAPWINESIESFPRLFIVNTRDNGGAQDVWDQRASIAFDYLLPSAGVEIYAEVGINDYGPGLDGYMRYPFHSMVYTGGFRKTVNFSKDERVKGEILFEWTSLEMSQDFQFQWPTTFYMHHEITQGYTNEGQWLGAGIGTGGNSQYLGYRVYHNLGFHSFYFQRVNPDNDYLYALTVGTVNDSETAVRIEDFKSTISFGVGSMYKHSESFSFGGNFVFTLINNPLYDSISWRSTEKEYNFTVSSVLKYNY